MKIKEIATSEQQKTDAREHYFIFHIMHLDGGEWLKTECVRAQWQFAIKMHTFIHVQENIQYSLTPTKLANRGEAKKKCKKRSQFLFATRHC